MSRKQPQPKPAGIIKPTPPPAPPAPPRVRPSASLVRTCRVCGCTDYDCSGCIDLTGEACEWVSDDLCSACLMLIDDAYLEFLAKLGGV